MNLISLIALRVGGRMLVTLRVLQHRAGAHGASSGSDFVKRLFFTESRYRNVSYPFARSVQPFAVKRLSHRVVPAEGLPEVTVSEGVAAPERCGEVSRGTGRYAPAAVETRYRTAGARNVIDARNYRSSEGHISVSPGVIAEQNSIDRTWSVVGHDRTAAQD